MENPIGLHGTRIQILITIINTITSYGFKEDDKLNQEPILFNCREYFSLRITQQEY